MPVNPFSASLTKKIGMAVTGILLYGFLVAHLSGNLLLLLEDGGSAFNAYAGFLTNHPLLIPAEIGLIVLFVVHLYLAITVSIENWRARPVGYQVTRSAGGRTWASTDTSPPALWPTSGSAIASSSSSSTRPTSVGTASSSWAPAWPALRLPLPWPSWATTC